MKNLGKIVLLLHISVITLFAGVRASVTPNPLTQGETAKFVLEIEGGEINKPVITTICGSDVLSTASQTSIAIVNGEYTKSYRLSYEFAPQKSCRIEPVSVTVDGKVEKSNAVGVTVQKAKADAHAKFLLELIPSKTDVYVGEPFWLTLKLTQKKNAEVVDSKFLAPDFKGFWVKEESPATREQTSTSIITTMRYKLAPQREGNLTITPAHLSIATRVSKEDIWGSFMPQIKWSHYYSNEVHIHAKALPGNLTLVGNFSIDAKADETEVKAGEAVNVVVTVKGDGNLEDIESFKPSLPNVNVFAQKPEIKGNVLTQKLAFVADESFEVPSFSLTFFNLKTKRVQHITTKPIAIKVIASGKEPSVEVQRANSDANSAEPKRVESTTTPAYSWLGIMFGIGFIAGGLFIYLLRFVKLPQREEKFDIKDTKKLIVKLLPYKDEDAEVAELLRVLEENLYSGKAHAVDKKQLKEILKRHKIA